MPLPCSRRFAQPDAEGNEDEERTLADLMVEQVEFADVIMLNKVDMLEEGAAGLKQLNAIEALLKKLNPGADGVRTRHGQVPLERILNTQRFDMDKAQKSAGWLAELAKPAHTPETEEYGVSSLLFRAQRPFHPTRLQAMMKAMLGGDDSADEGTEGDSGSEGGTAQKRADDGFAGVLRSKGQVWLANAHGTAFTWHSAGHVFSLQPREPYIARALETELGVDAVGDAFPSEVGAARDARLVEAAERVFGGDEEVLQDMARLKEVGQWCARYGDRFQELVLIGVILDKPKMRADLEACLLTDEEYAGGPAAWRELDDAFFGGDAAELYWDLPPPETEPEVDPRDDPERQGRVVGAAASSFEALEATALQVEAKGAFFDRGVHRQQDAMARWLGEQEEAEFKHGEFATRQLLVAQLCDDADCKDAHSADGVQPTVAGPDEIRDACGQLVAGLPASFREAVRRDAEALTAMCMRLCPKVPWVTLRLEIVQHNACWRWHQDGYTSRALICYVGPGTCAVDDEAVAWDQFAKTMGDDTNESCVPDKDSILQMQNNAVLLMKGDAWPGIIGKGLTHKSPDLRGSADPPKRLILKVDLNEFRLAIEEDGGDADAASAEEDEGRLRSMPLKRPATSDVEPGKAQKVQRRR